MKECLNCKKEFQERRSTARFCSNKCRSAFNRGASGNKITKMQMQEMYNAIMGATEALKGYPGFIPQVLNPISHKDAVAIYNAENKDQRTSLESYDYNGMKELIIKATSSYELEFAWKIVKAASWLAGWQIRELTRLKDLQQTRIDF
jgi:endogenous inhibitor of DNA gyrase (YacG/DUF329 family)